MRPKYKIVVDAENRFSKYSREYFYYKIDLPLPAAISFVHPSVKEIRLYKYSFFRGWKLIEHIMRDGDKFKRV